MTEPAEKDKKPDLTVSHGAVTVPDIKVAKLRLMHDLKGVEFPVDADESRRRGGTSVDVRETLVEGDE